MQNNTDCPNCKTDLREHSNAQQCTFNELSKIDRKNISFDLESKLQSNGNLKNEIHNCVVKQECVFECECLENKKYRLVFDGGDSGKYVVHYCQICYEQDDKQFMISMEIIL